VLCPVIERSDIGGAVLLGGLVQRLMFGKWSQRQLARCNFMYCASGGCPL
jgi:hypothetical protein